MWRTLIVLVCISFGTILTTEARKSPTKQTRIKRAKKTGDKTSVSSPVSESAEPEFRDVPSSVREILLKTEDKTVRNIVPNWRENQCLLIDGRYAVLHKNTVYCRNGVYRYQVDTLPWWAHVVDGKIVVQTRFSEPVDTYVIITHSENDETTPSGQFYIALREP